MDTVLASVDNERTQRARAFETQIGNDNFDFLMVAFDDAKVTGAQICMAAGRHPVEDYVVLRHLGTGELETLRPTETSDLDKNKVGRFFVVANGPVVKNIEHPWCQDICICSNFTGGQ